VEVADVSVIIPCYNAEKFLRSTLESILNQTILCREIIAVNDGSTDGTLELLRSYKDKIKIITIKNSGPAVARNVGIKVATSKYIAFCDSDDIWLPNKIEKQFVHFGNPFIFCARENFSDEGEPSLLYQHPTENMLLEKTGILLNNFVTTSGVLVLKNVLKKVGLFDERFRCSEDWHLWIRIRRLYDFTYIKDPLVKYNVRFYSISRDYIELYYQTKQVIEDIFLNYIQDFQIDKATVLKRHCFSAANMAYYMGKFDESIYLLKELYKMQGFTISLLSLFFKNHIRKALSFFKNK